MYFLLPIRTNKRFDFSQAHVYCFECIENWSRTENSCPLCKTRFTVIEKIDTKALVAATEAAAVSGSKRKPKLPKAVKVKIKKKNQSETIQRENPNELLQMMFIESMFNRGRSGLMGAAFASMISNQLNRANSSRRNK